MLSVLRRMFNSFLGLFRIKKDIKLGLYGPPNGGKTTLANLMCQEFVGEEASQESVSKTAHETREVMMREKIETTVDGRKLCFNLVDTPGIATKIDYEDFMKVGLREADAKVRAKEATKGVIEAIKWLDNMDSVIVVLDATKDPYSQVNITILGNLQARNIPVIIAANKIDLKKADITRIETAFPQYKVIGISAKFGKDTDKLYKELANMIGR